MRFDLSLRQRKSESTKDKNFFDVYSGKERIGELVLSSLETAILDMALSIAMENLPRQFYFNIEEIENE